MANKTIGLFRCGICGSTKARVSVSRAGLPVITCNSCHSQTFARSDVSDGLIREQLLPLPVVETIDPKGPEVLPAQEKPAEPVKEKSSWEIF